MVTLAVTSCGVDTQLPKGAEVLCASNADCPEDYVCVGEISRCLPTGTENDPPQFSDVTLSRVAVAVGVELEVAFTVSEQVYQQPAVELVMADEGTVPAQLREKDGSRYRFVYRPQGAEAQGTYDIQATAVDLAGNVAADVPLGEVVFDFEAPTIESLTADVQTLKAGATAHLVLRVDEPLGVAALGFDADTDFATEASSDPLEYPFSYSATGAEAEDARDVVVTIEDLAGNPATLTVAEFLSFDFTPPSLSAASVPLARARAGVTVSASFTADEPLDSATPSVVLVPLAGAELPMSLEASSASSFSFTHTIGGTDADGAYTVRLAAFRDRAGNEGVPQSLGLVTIDKQPPQVTSSSLPSSLSPGQAYVVSLAIDEPLAAVPSLSLDGGATSLALVPRSMPEAGFTYSFDGAAPLSATSGFFSLTLRMTDVAGNQSVESLTTVEIDLQPPELVSLQVAPAIVRPGDTVRWVLAATEPLSGAPTFTTSPATALPLSIADATPGRLSYTYSYLVQPSDDGHYELQGFTLEDGALNPRSVAAGLGAFDVDQAPPEIDVAGASVATDNAFDPALAADGDTTTLVVTLLELIATPATALIGGTPMELVDTITGAASTTFTFEAVASGATDDEGAHIVTLTARDEVGNQTVENLGLVTYDFSPPTVAPGSVSVQLVPSEDNLHRSVTSATLGTTVRVTFNLTEPLRNDVAGFPPTPRVRLSTIDFQQVSHGGTLYVYEAVLAGLALNIDELRMIRITAAAAPMQDLAGNTQADPVDLAEVPVDTIRPSVPDVSRQANGTARIVYDRRPWGSTNGAVPSFSISGAASSVAAGLTVFAFDGPDLATANVIGSSDATVAGFGPLELDATDRAEVYIAAVDAAGNVSDASGTSGDGDDCTLVRDGVWRANLGDKLANSTLANPHRASVASALDESLVQESSRTFELEQGAVDAVALADGATVTYSGERTWSLRLGQSEGPPPRARSPLVYDSSRGVVVLFGGLGSCASSSGFCGDTWEWNGHRWLELTPFGTSPSDRGGHALAYDASRGRTVLFSGDGITDDTWEWDGFQWLDLTPASGNPPARFDHVMSYDAQDGRVLMYGGAELGDLWAWDDWGSPDCPVAAEPCWKQLADTGDGPIGRVRAAMAYLPQVGATVVFGGRRWSGDCNNPGSKLCNDTWHWTGTTWQHNLDAGSPPPEPCGGAMSYDANIGGLVFYGGNADANCDNTGNNGSKTTWAYGLWGGPTCSNAAAPCWRQIVTADAATQRTRVGVVFDPLRDELVMFGGADTDPGGNCSPAGVSGCGDTWLFDGTNWREHVLADERPAARSLHAMAYDESRDRAVLYGGIAELATCASSPCYADDTWLWTGDAWVEACTGAACAVTPGPLANHAMAYDGARDRVVLFGGHDGSLPAGDTWEWDGSDWSLACEVGSGSDPCGQEPARRQDLALAYDSNRDVTVLFGGFGVGNCDGSGSQTCDGTWEWGMWGAGICANGSAGPCWRDVSPGAGPPKRSNHGMAYDARRQRVVLFGGIDGLTKLDDTWLWDGTTWTQACTTAPCNTTRPTARRVPAMAWDAQRERVVLFGGNDTRELWEWDGSRWTQMTPTHVTPSALGSTAMISRAGRGELMLFGGSLGGLPRRDTWVLDTDPGARPAVLFDLDLSRSHVQRNDVLGLTLACGGGGTGSATLVPGVGAQVNGAELVAWDFPGGEWAALDSGVVAAGSSEALSYASPTAREALRYISPTRAMVGVRPVGELGTGRLVPSVTADYFDVILEYRIDYQGSCGDGIVYGDEECEPPGSPGCSLSCKEL